MSQVKIDVVIPTYRPGQKFIELMEKLNHQTIPLHKIIIVNTEEKYWNQLFYGKSFEEDHVNAEVFHIAKREFNHGRSRNEAIRRSNAQIVIFMTQDAVPEDEHLVEELIKPMVDPEVAVTYARQLPTTDCQLIERFTREFNYPAGDRVQELASLSKLGIKTYFCSNVCAAYKRHMFDELGGFVNFTIFNEDMIFAAHAIQNGKKIYYASKARVIHSHNYTGKQQFKRNFDLGVSQADHPEIFADVPSKSEGIRLVRETYSYLWKVKKPFLIITLLWKSACKFFGYRLGYQYKRLSHKRILRYTANRPYWERYWDKHQIPADVHAGYGKNKEGL